MTRLDIVMADYREVGFARVAGFVDPAQCRRLQEVSRRIISESYARQDEVVRFGANCGHDENPLFLDSGDVARVFHEPGAETGDEASYSQGVARIGHGLHACVEEVVDFLGDQRLSSLLRALGFGRPAVIESLFLFKGERAGTLHVHCDHVYLPTNPPSVVLLWFALDAADEENGCLYVDPNGPRRAVAHVMRREGDVARVEGADAMPAFGELIPVPAEAGDLLVVDGLLPHASGPGSRRRGRDALGVHVIDATASLPDDLYLGHRQLLPL